jgi:hypothetical protein
MEIKKHTKTTIILSAISAVFLGITANVFRADHQLETYISFTISFVGLGVVFWWYVKDSDLYSYQRNPFLNIAIVAITVFAIPYYMIRSRGFKKALFAIFMFFVLTAFWYLIYLLNFQVIALLG